MIELIYFWFFTSHSLTMKTLSSKPSSNFWLTGAVSLFSEFLASSNFYLVLVLVPACRFNAYENSRWERQDNFRINIKNVRGINSKTIEPDIDISGWHKNWLACLENCANSQPIQWFAHLERIGIVSYMLTEVEEFIEQWLNGGQHRQQKISTFTALFPM